MRISDWSSDVCSSDLEHVHEPAFGGRRVLILAKQADFVTDAGPTEMGDAQAGVDSVGKGEGVNKLAMRFRAQSDQRAAVNVESAVPDQIFIDHRVEVDVVLDVIDVPRSEERRVGKEGVRTCQSRWVP